ncbi:hypothetical protein B5M09_006786 [Aphanomyces astaci]|uniref:protein-serine/threonine phosphatase n=1 Tax=Aphanomyces astaci TaxID=112090 RepID=A0A425DEB6_APHAT|nr:hypothetical protein B5M09_006786 [Aphanomyces astaci]
MEKVNVQLGAAHQGSEATLSRAEDFKEKGNDALKAFKFPLAVEMYTTAISLIPTAIYYSNRAAAHIKMESYGLALEDASESIKIDPSYIKAYYRRASANLPLGHLKDALRDYRTVVKMKPTSAEAKSKMKLCEQLIRQAAFAEAIQSERHRPLSETIDVSAMVVDSSYDGPHLPETPPSTEFITDVLDHFKRGKLLHRKYVLQILLSMKSMLQALPSLLRIPLGSDAQAHITVCGDTHGEVKHKYDDVVMNLFSEVFNWLPLAACIESKVLVVHGGLFHQDNVTLADIEKIDRNREPPESGTLLVRSHEVKDEGYLVEHDEKCITVFSAPNYCDQMGNKGAYIRFYRDLKPRFTQFTAVVCHYFL